MRLSIIVLFCDDDYQYLERCINSVKEHIKFDDYEIIAIDNRNTKTIEVNIPNVRIETKGYNLNCFEGRKFGCSKAFGEYIWNIDVDDLIVGDLTKEDINKDVDFFQMYYSCDTKNSQPITNIHLPRAYGPNVWSRIYSKKMLDGIYSKIDREVNIFMAEDKILFDFVMETNPSYEYIQKIIYQYNMTNATNNKIVKKENIDLIKTGINDYEYIYSLMKKDNSKFIIRNINKILNKEEK